MSTKTVTALTLALSRMAHSRMDCLRLLPTEQWTKENGNYIDECRCEIATVRAVLAEEIAKVVSPPLTEGDRWVDCRQELPPILEDVWVWVIYQDGHACGTEAYRQEPDARQNPAYGEWNLGSAKNYTVTHWQPLPAPPKLTASPDLPDDVQTHGVFNICHERSPRDKSRCHRELGHDGRHTSRNDGWYTPKADLEVEGDK